MFRKINGLLSNAGDSNSATFGVNAPWRRDPFVRFPHKCRGYNGLPGHSEVGSKDGNKNLRAEKKAIPAGAGGIKKGRRVPSFLFCAGIPRESFERESHAEAHQECVVGIAEFSSELRETQSASHWEVYSGEEVETDANIGIIVARIWII